VRESIVGHSSSSSAISGGMLALHLGIARAGALVLLRYALANPSAAGRVALARTVAVLEASR